MLSEMLYLFLCSYETKKSQDLVSVMRAREVTRWCRYSREVMRVDVGLAREVTGVVVGFAREVMRWWCLCVPEMVLYKEDKECLCFLCHEMVFVKLIVSSHQNSYLSCSI